LDKFLIYLCLLLSTTVALGGNSDAKITNNKTRLHTVNQHIQQVKKSLTKAHQNKDHLIKELEKTEVAINHLTNALNATKKSLQTQTQALQNLKVEEAQETAQLEMHRGLLTQQIISSYQLGKYDYVKLLLNQQDPYTISRTLAYYRYINQARIEVLTKVQTIVNNLKHKHLLIQQHTAKLAKTSQQQQDKQAQLQVIKEKRQKVLTQLNGFIKTRDQKLTELVSEQRQLEKIIHKLQAKHRGLFKAKVAFQKTRGKLPWPSKGIVLQHYGANVAGHQFQSTGMLISAPEGNEVKAVHPGRVVFANWLKGFGLLMIIDHNEGYMSLYAHNHNLYRNVGDIVGRGDIIATVGHSGGNHQNALYFELRHKGKPFNPEKWLRT